jgi:hypothetical protein
MLLEHFHLFTYQLRGQIEIVRRRTEGTELYRFDECGHLGETIHWKPFVSSVAPS